MSGGVRAFRKDLRRGAYLTDLNDGRLRDAGAPGAASAYGTVYTAKIPPEEIPEGGKAVAYASSREEIGIRHRDEGLRVIEPIYTGKLRWEDDFAPQLVDPSPLRKDVLRGVELRCLDNRNEGRILHRRDSFRGIHRAPGAGSPGRSGG